MSLFMRTLFQKSNMLAPGRGHPNLRTIAENGNPFCPWPPKSPWRQEGWNGERNGVSQWLHWAGAAHIVGKGEQGKQKGFVVAFSPSSGTFFFPTSSESHDMWPLEVIVGISSIGKRNQLGAMVATVTLNTTARRDGVKGAGWRGGPREAEWETTMP
mmetsp:Transcript_40027/g.73942  ORF Transcript_40027/g.73942 Transcript_40027/m.73942 type:complete len:157 (-) Transcript_40027:173-643(-)